MFFTDKCGEVVLCHHENLVDEEAIAHAGLQGQKKKKKLVE
jgi:hypothetical protein